MKRVLIGSALAVAGIVGVAGLPPGGGLVSAENPNPPNEGVCQPQADHQSPPNDSTKSLTVTAPAGMLISGYCVKAGSINQDTEEVELGPVYRYFEPGDYRTSVTIEHPSKKDISHYIVFYVEDDRPEPTPVTPPVPTVTRSCDAVGTVELPQAEGLTYSQLPLDGGVEVTVVAQAGYVIERGATTRWVFTADQLAILTGDACPQVESNPPPTLEISALAPVCVGDIPYIEYAVGLQGLDPAGRTVTLTLRDLGGAEIGVYRDLPLSGRILYPGADDDPQDWPGWKRLESGEWVIDPTDARWREGVEVIAEVNPSASGRVAYPPATAACAGPAIVPPTAPAAPAAPTTPDVVAAAGPVPTALPSTGTSSWLLAVVATALLLAGSGFLRLARRGR